MRQFKTHKSDIVKGRALNNAINSVFDKLVAQSRLIRKEDSYATHITEKQKNEFLRNDLERYEKQCKEFLKGNWGNAIWFLQMLDFELTGESIPILP